MHSPRHREPETRATTTEPVQLTEGPRIRLNGISWEVYEALAREAGNRPALRMTYDNGALELMTTSPEHEWLKKLMARMIEAMSVELGLPLRSGGSFTHKREDLLKGLEPDECYWIQNAAVIGNKIEINLQHDPPPDLAIEIDITSNSINHESIYAAFGIRELWRYDGKRLQALGLSSAGRYEGLETSIAIPGLPVGELMQFLQLEDSRHEQGRVLDCVAWVKTLDLNLEGMP